MLIHCLEMWTTWTERVRSLPPLTLLQLQAACNTKTTQEIDVNVHNFSFCLLIWPVEILLETVLLKGRKPRMCGD